MMKYNEYTRYIIYSNGQIFDLKLNKFLSFQINKDGYYKVTLKNDFGKRKTFSVHRLVAFLYINNFSNKKTEVNHIDGNKKNNDYLNLEWCTHSQNIKHAWDNKLLKNTEQRIKKIKDANIGRFGKLNARSKVIQCIETGEIFESIELAGKHYNICAQGIGKVALGKQKSAGKHKFTNQSLTWRYINE